MSWQPYTSHDVYMKHLKLYNKPVSNIRQPVRMTTKSLPITLQQHSFAHFTGTQNTTFCQWIPSVKSQ